MTVAWNDGSRIIEQEEGTEVNSIFNCTTNIESGHHAEIIFLSSTLPGSIQKEILSSGNGVSGIKLYGTLPSITSQQSYRVTARLQEYHITGSKKNIDYFEDIGITIINDIIIPTWKQGYTIPIAYEKAGYSIELSDAVNYPNGDEVYRKSYGELPNSLTLYPSGTISGTPLESEITYNPDAPHGSERIRDPYIFGITVYKDGEVIINEKRFSLDVYTENKKIPPTWVTESGLISSVNSGDTVRDLKVIAVISSDEEDLPEDKLITYKLIDLGEDIPSGYTEGLPPGLSIETRDNQCIIYGRVATSQITTYTFTICPYRQYQGVWYPADPSSSEITDAVRNASRTFLIMTNKPTPEHEIIWGEDGLPIHAGTFSIGTVINDSLPEAVAVDGSSVKYSIIDRGNLPSYIDIDINGNITGTVEYPIGDYYCIMRASTPYTYITRIVQFHIVKGLGYNSLNLSLRINLEYKDEFNEIRDQLNSTALYGTGQEGYNIDVFPKIDIATLTCFDRELLAGIFNYGNPEIVRFLETRYKTYTDEDVNGNPTEAYEAYYKAVDENTYQWDPINNGNFDYEQELQNEKDLTSAAEGSTYSEPPFYPMENNAKLEFDNEYYNSVVDQKQWVSSLTETGKYELANVHVTTSPQVEYKVFNFKNVREALQKKIYVYKKTGDFYYDLGNQELFDKSNITTKKLYEEQIIDDENKVKYQYHMCNEDDTEDTVVKYVEHKVYDLHDNLLSGILFKPTFDTHPFMLDSEEEIYYLEEITNPWCLDFNNEENDWLSMDKIPEGAEMCLPRISDDDLSDDGTYIQMLNTKFEPLPKWKRKEAKYWEAETTYNINDIIYYNSKYYLVIKKFKTEYAFEYDTENMRLLENDEVKEQLSKQFFPTLDLGYYKAGKNRAFLNNLNEAEKKGNYWYNKDFFFWEVTCEPVYNESIEMFGVPFYSTDHDDNKDDSEYGKKTYELIVDNPSSGYDVSLFINGENIVTASSAIQSYYQYIHIGNSYKVTVNRSTTIRWSVSADDYFTETGNHVVVVNTVKNVSLVKKAILTVNPIPSDANVVLTAYGYNPQGNTIEVRPGTIVSYTVSKDGYKEETGNITVNDTRTVEIELTEMVTAIVVPEPNTGLADITITATGYTQQGYSITVPKGTSIHIVITCPGFFDEEVDRIVTENGNIIVPLEEN